MHRFQGTSQVSNAMALAKWCENAKDYQYRVLVFACHSHAEYYWALYCAKCVETNAEHTLTREQFATVDTLPEAPKGKRRILGVHNVRGCPRQPTRHRRSVLRLLFGQSGNRGW